MFLCPIQIKISMQVRFLRIMLKSIYRYIFFGFEHSLIPEESFNKILSSYAKLKNSHFFYTNNKIKIPINTRRIFHEQFHYLSMQHQKNTIKLQINVVAISLKNAQINSEATNLAKMLKGKYSNFKDYSNLAILQHNNKQEYKVILISTKCNFHRLLGVMISK